MLQFRLLATENTKHLGGSFGIFLQPGDVLGSNLLLVRSTRLPSVEILLVPLGLNVAFHESEGLMGH